jgi:hypothetical protein
MHDRRLCPPQAYKLDDRDIRLAWLAADQWGVVSVQELLALGFTRQAIAVRVGNGRLHRLYRGVYAVGHTSLSREGRFLAAVKACGPGAALSHLAAAVHYEFCDPLDRIIDVTVQAGSTRCHPGIRVHRTLSLDAINHRGIRTTLPLRTLHDCALDTTDRHLRRLVRRAQSVDRVNVRQLATSNRLAAIAATGPAPTRSELEDVVLDALLPVFAHPEVNQPLYVNARKLYPDFRWPEQRLILEADGEAWHDPVLDAERQAILEAYGERVLRVDWREAVGDQPRLLARLTAAGAPTLNRP